jgi:hypothetical protein
LTSSDVNVWKPEKELSADDVINWKNDNVIDWRIDEDDEEKSKVPLQLAQSSSGVEVPISAEYEDDNKPSKFK